MKKKKEKNTSPTIENRQARFKFSISETFEAGLELKGSEVKSIRASQISLQEGFAFSKKGELFLDGVHIAPYEQTGTHDQHPQIRKIRLLLHKREIIKISQKLDQEGLALIPLKIYFHHQKAKILLGLGKGKKLFDKRQDARKNEIEKSLRKNFKL
ncbi:MAG: SsrA-binding protein SmpB [Bdellovibrionales bacterium]|nr:SsrA-binding protein SmpB [Bdellovibrionales bacterium]